MDKKTPYIHDINVHNGKSATELVPILMQLFSPNSVVDLGCGLGDWLNEFQKNKVPDILGIDGQWVDKKRLYIDEKDFLEKDLTQAFKIDKKFDLAMSLEVAEHLPEKSADTFIDTLTNLSDKVIFSAAIPNQGGQNHINEQWHTYWIEKFESRGFYCHDILRPLIWDNPNIEWWYSQNIYLFSKTPPTSTKTNFINAAHPQLLSKNHQELLDLKARYQQPKLLFRLLIKSLVSKIFSR